jgi:hypothetical protein
MRSISDLHIKIRTYRYGKKKCTIIYRLHDYGTLRPFHRSPGGQLPSKGYKEINLYKLFLKSVRPITYPSVGTVVVGGAALWVGEMTVRWTFETRLYRNVKMMKSIF